MNSETALMSEIRTQILKKSKAFFMKSGVKSPSMDDIARQLTISKKTLYQHFSSKQDLLAQIFSCEEEEESVRIENIHLNATNAIEEIILIGQYVVEDLKQLMLYLPTVYEIKKYYAEVWLQYETKMYEHIYAGIFQNLERGKNEGLYRADLSSDMVAKFYVQIANAILNSEIFPDDKYYKPNLYQEFKIYHLRGIVSEKGLTVLEQNLKNIAL